MSNLVPTPITDKNGKRTTVRKKPDQASPAVTRYVPSTPVKLPSGLLEYTLVDGSKFEVPEDVKDFRGTTVDDFGNIVAVVKGFENSDGSEYLVALTPCCFATGKGVSGDAEFEDEGYVGCRNCYEPVGYTYAGEIKQNELNPVAA